MTAHFLYVGTYSRPAPYLAATNGKGIYVYTFDAATGALQPSSEMLGIDNASYLTIDPKQRHLYAISEVLEWQEGLITAYAIDPATGALSYLNKQSSMGRLACYDMVDRTGRWVVLTNYIEGNAAIFPIRPDGKIGEASDIVRHTGSGPDATRQEGPHAHSIVIDPTNTYAYVADLGIDQIVGYRLDLENGKLTDNSAVILPPGSGPRHFVFHPSGRYAYVIMELASQIGALAHDPHTGTLRLLQTVPALPNDYDGHSHCADIQVHPSGRFVYGSNRGHDSIVIYAVDQESGRLTYVGHEPTQGRTPRNFMVDPSGTFLLVANQDSDNIVTFRIDPKTGKLTSTGHVVSAPTPVCLKMAVI